MTDHAPALARASRHATEFALANCIRALAIDGVEAAKSGHPGAPMGMAEAATVLWTKHLTFDAAHPHWPNRDRFVLSNGHGSMLLYALLYLTGFEDMTLDELRNFRQWGSKTAGHPEYGHAAGVDITTGPLGQGLAGAVGMCIAERSMAATFGPEIVDHRTWVFCGDGCLMEGISQEAISLAGHLKLDKLTLIYDDNGISIDGDTDKSFTEDVPARFRACGWHVVSCDGHDIEAIDRAIEEAKAVSDRPSLVVIETVIGLGSPNRAGKESVHGAPLGAEERALVRAGPVVGLGGFFGSRRPVAELAGVRPAWCRSAQRMGGPCRCSVGRRPERVRAAHRGADARAARCRHRRGASDAVRQAAEGRDAQGEPDGAGDADGGLPGDDRRLGRPHRIEPHPRRRRRQRFPAGRSRRALRVVRRARVRDGGRDERDVRPWRRDPLRRHLPRVLRLWRATRSASRR